MKIDKEKDKEGKIREVKIGGLGRYIREPMGKKIEGYEALIPSEGFKY